MGRKRDSTNSGDSGKQRRNEETNNLDDDDSVNNEKRVLKSQITELEDLISEIEFSLNLPKFGDIENPEVSEPPAEEPKRSYKLKNLDYILQHELYKFSGLYCTKFTKHEYIFNFSPFSKVKADSLYTVQFFTNSEKGTMGKYIMPSSGVMENILSESPIDKLMGLIPFFRNCKRHLDCYVDRKEQYDELRELTSTVKNFRVDSDRDYVLIMCSFLQVYRKKSDNLIDMTVYLSYDYGKARPSTVNVDWSMKRKPSEEDTKGMRSFMKIFKSLSLVEGYQRIVNSSHDIFTWQPSEAEQDDILDLNNVSDASDEEVMPVRQRGAARKRRRSQTPEGSETDGEDDPQDREELHEKKSQTKKRARKTKAVVQKGNKKPVDEGNPIEREKSSKKVTQKSVKKKGESKQKLVEQQKVKEPQKSSEPFRKPKTRQSLLTFSRRPKNPEEITPTGKDPTSRTVSSTPMTKIRGKRVHSPGGISPIVADKSSMKSPRGRGRSPKITKQT